MTLDWPLSALLEWDREGVLGATDALLMVGMAALGTMCARDWAVV